MSDTEELKPCHRCGKYKGEFIEHLGLDYWIARGGCNCYQSSRGRTRQEAIDLYNTRPVEDALNKRIAKMEHEIATDNNVLELQVEVLREKDNRIETLESDLAEAKAEIVELRKPGGEYWKAR